MANADTNITFSYTEADHMAVLLQAIGVIFADKVPGEGEIWATELDLIAKKLAPWRED